MFKEMNKTDLVTEMEGKWYTVYSDESGSLFFSHDGNTILRTYPSHCQKIIIPGHKGAADYYEKLK